VNISLSSLLAYGYRKHNGRRAEPVLALCVPSGGVAVTKGKTPAPWLGAGRHRGGSLGAVGDVPGGRRSECDVDPAGALRAWCTPVGLRMVGVLCQDGSLVGMLCKEPFAHTRLR
jgi:hypothetical protein